MATLPGRGSRRAEGVSGPWPQWRGPNGSGVSTESNLPQSWSSDGKNIRWKVRIPGEGASSPVVSNGRVFLTTAYDSAKATLVAAAVATAAALLTIAYVVAAALEVVSRRRKQTQQPTTVTKPTLAGNINTAVTVLTSFAFVSLGLLIVLAPHHYDTTVGRLLASSIGNEDINHLFYLARGVESANWLNAGGVALLGLAVALGWLRPHSIWRIFGAVAVWLFVIAFLKFTPANLWKHPVELKTKIIFALPALAVVFWHLLNYPRVRFCPPAEAPGGMGSTGASRPAQFWKTMNAIQITITDKNIRHWRHKMSLPIIAVLLALSVLIFVQANYLRPATGLQRTVVCVDFDTGDILWQRGVFVAGAGRKHSDNTYATPTPAADGGYVVAGFDAGLACLDFEGHIIWKRPDHEHVGDTRYGAAGSPLIRDEKVFFAQPREELTEQTTRITAFEIDTGRIIWRITPREISGDYTTPMLYEDGAGVQLISASTKNISSFDVESGALLWSVEIPIEQLVASMARQDDILCIGGGTWGPDGLTVMRLTGRGGDTNVNILWQSSKNTPGCSSPVIYRSKLFTITDTGVMTCYDIDTGSVFWKKRFRGRYLSSLLAADRKIYACNTRGLTTVIAAEKSTEILAENSLPGDCRASFAVADSALLIRTGQYLYRIEKKCQSVLRSITTKDE